jgi:hypothetical protein
MPWRRVGRPKEVRPLQVDPPLPTGLRTYGLPCGCRSLRTAAIASGGCNLPGAAADARARLDCARRRGHRIPGEPQRRHERRQDDVIATTNGEVPANPVGRLAGWVSLRWSGTPRRWPVQGEIAAKRSALHCYSIARFGGSELDSLRPRACVTRILYDARNDFSGNRSPVRTTTSRVKAWHSRRREQFHSLQVSTNNDVMRRTRREPPPALTHASSSRCGTDDHDRFVAVDE